MDIHFIVAGRAVTRENVREFGPGVTADRLDRIADVLQDTAADIRCAKHATPPVVTCRGDSLAELDYEVAACCPEFGAALAERLRRRAKPSQILGGADGGAVVATPRQKLRRMNRAFGPIAAGLIIDSVDLVTYGPMKRFMGFPAGMLAGYWMASIFKLPQRQRLLCALAAGIYCFIPGLEFIPVATLIGAYIRFRDVGDDDGA